MNTPTLQRTDRALLVVAQLDLIIDRALMEAEEYVFLDGELIDQAVAMHAAAGDPVDAAYLRCIVATVIKERSK